MSNQAREVFIKNLHYWMKKRGITQSKLATLLNLPLSTVSSWYNGQSYPRVDSMQKLADILEISMKSLTDENEENENSFKSVDDAIKFILEQPLVANFGGYDPEKMTDDEIMEFAEDVSRMIEMLGKKYNK